MSRSLADLLASRVVLFDGAMGTELYKRNHFVNVCFEELCVREPKAVREVHEANRKAGADVLTTNSFGANRYKLSDYLLAERTVEIASAAARLAREAAGDELLVAGSVGPLGRHASGGALSEAESVAAFAETMRALMDGGADFILLETFGRARDLRFAVEAARSLGVPYLPSMAFGDIEASLGGESIDDFFACCLDGGRSPLALGFNCSIGPKQMLDYLEDYLPRAPLPVLAMPNAGAPQHINDRMFYMTSPEYFASYAARFVELGAAAVGGCCGTGPEHIAEASRRLKAQAKIAGRLEIGGAVESADGKGSAAVDAQCPACAAVEPAALAPAAPLAERSRFGRKLAAGEWVASVEITPPLGWDLTKTIERARRCAEAGVDAINIPDGPRASSRTSPLVTAIRIQNEAGIEAVLHVTCRDRNIIGVQSDLLGCAAAGVANLLIVTGDPPKLGDYPNATAVFDMDSIGLTRAAQRLNGGVDIGGKSFSPPTRFVTGVGADPTNLDKEKEIERFYRKAEAGAEFAITQPVYDAEALLSFIERAKGAGVPIIAGIWPLASYNNALFMNNEVPGVSIPEPIMERMKAAPDKEAARQVGIDTAREILAAVRPAVAGVQVSAPFGNVETAIAVMRP